MLVSPQSLPPVAENDRTHLACVKYPTIDYQDIIYYSAPKQQKPKLNSLEEVDPTLLEAFEKSWAFPV